MPNKTESVHCGKWKALYLFELFKTNTEFPFKKVNIIRFSCILLFIICLMCIRRYILLLFSRCISFCIPPPPPKSPFSLIPIYYSDSTIDQHKMFRKFMNCHVNRCGNLATYKQTCPQSRK